jgi:hypothetical protein
MNTLHTWEHLPDDVSRLAVPGGWLYRSVVFASVVTPGMRTITTPASVALQHVPDPTAPHVLAVCPVRAAKREAKGMAEQSKRDKEHTDRVRAAVGDYLSANWTHQGGGVYMLRTTDGLRWLCDFGYAVARAKLHAADGSYTLSAELNWSGILFGAVDHPDIAPIAAIIRQHAEAP